MEIQYQDKQVKIMEMEFGLIVTGMTQEELKNLLLLKMEIETSETPRRTAEITEQIDIKMINKEEKKMSNTFREMVKRAINDGGEDIQEKVFEKLDYESIALRVKERILDQVDMDSIAEDVAKDVEEEIVDKIMDRAEREIDYAAQEIADEFEIEEGDILQIAGDLEF